MKTHWRILVVANDGYGESLCARFRADGHSVEQKRFRAEALETVRDRQHAIYFVDLETSVNDVTDIIAQIRNLHPEASVVVTSRGPAMSVDEFSRLVQKVLPDSSDGNALINLETMEKRLISAILEHTGGNIRESSRVLGVDRSTLYEKIKRYEIPRNRAVKGRKRRLDAPAPQ
jgi:DNA-binding NtrC family response regulator